MKTQKERINASVVHLLSFASTQLMRSAFALAAVTEPWATKGLKAPHYTFAPAGSKVLCIDLEIEILSYVKDKNVVRLMNNLKKVLACKKRFEKINDIEIYDFVADDEIYEMASNVFVGDDDSPRSYEKRVKDDCDFNFFLYLNIWRCTELLTTLSTNINEDFENIYYREIYDYVEGYKKSNDTNVQLLFDLMADLESD